MSNIRKANIRDLARIAEIEIFNYRLNFYPIFKNDSFYFDELQVPEKMKTYICFIEHLWVYDDGVVKGFLQEESREIKKLFVEPVLQGQSIGSELLEHAIAEMDANSLWALEKNTRAIAFYQRHGFHLTDERKYEADTSERLVRLEK